MSLPSWKKTSQTTFHSQSTCPLWWPNLVDSASLWILTNPPLTYGCVSHWIVFQYTGLLVTSPALAFLLILLPLWELSLSWAPAVLDLLLAGVQAEVVSARLNPSHGTRDVGGVCSFLGFVSFQQKFEVTDQHCSPWTDQCYSSQMDECYSLWTDQCYSSVLFRK